MIHRDDAAPAVGQQPARAPVGHPRLAGRAAELAAISEFVGGIARHRSAVLVIDGPAGCGKTSLLRELVTCARQHSVRTVTATARLPASLPATGSGPCVFVIDDAHHMDADSLRRLAAYAEQLGETAVGIALALRREEPASDPNALDALRHTLGAVVLRPRPLSAGSIRVVVECTLGAPADPEFVHACRAATRGNPFLLTETLAELGSQQVAPDSAGANRVAAAGPAAVAQSIETLIAHLSPDALPVARALAVLGAAADPADVATLCEVDPAAASAQLAVLSGAALLRADSAQYLHPTVRRALYLATPEPERTRLHRGAARLVAGRAGVAAAQRAQHLAAFGQTMDPEVIEALSGVATAAAAAGDFAVAAACLTQALPGTLSPTGRAQTAARLAVYLERCGSGPATELLQHACDVLPEGPHRVGIAGHLIQVIAAGEGVRAAARAAADFGDALAADRTVLELLHVDTVTGARADVHGDGAAALLAAWRGVDRLSAVALAEAALARRPLASVPAAEQLAAALTLLYADEWTLLDQQLAEARRRGESGAELTILHARVALRRGDVVDAGQVAETAAAEVSAGRQPPVAVSIAATQAEVLLERGELAGGIGVLERAGAGPALRSTWTDVHLLEIRGRLRLATGDTVGGTADLRAAVTLLDRFGVSNPAVSPARVYLALARTGTAPEAAAAILADELSAARRWGTARTLGIAQHAAAAVADPAPAIDLLRAAVATQAAGGSSVEHARGLVDLGLEHAARQDRMRARDTLRAGLDLAQRCGAHALADRAHTALVAAGARPRRRAQTGLDALTASELRIVDLAAAGRTNREISTELYVTQRTVELHLTNAYRKLGIMHRHELAAAIQR